MSGIFGESLQAIFMRIIRTILQILILYAFHYIGVFIVELTRVPLPPSVVGLILLFICLQFKWIKVEFIRDGASFLIGVMLLFYIPPLLGIIEYPQLFSKEGLILMGAVTVSTLFALYITSILSKKIETKEEILKARKNENQKEEEIEETNNKVKGEEEVEHSTIHR